MVDSAMVIRALEPADIRATAALLAEAMADDPAYNFLFPRGQGHVARGERHWVVHMMAVDPSRQGRGLGSHLLNFILDATVDARTTGGKAPAVLTTHEERNVLFYERAGFEVDGAQTMSSMGEAPYRLWSMRRRPRT